MADDECKVFGFEYNSDDDSEYDICKEVEESDVYLSAPDEYSSEEWNDELVDHSEYDDSEDDMLTPDGTDDDDENRRYRYRGNTYDPRCPNESFIFQVGMKFESASQFRAAVKDHAIWNGFNITFPRSGDRKVEVVCKGNCPWRIYASLDARREAFVVKTLNDTHMCSRTPRNSQADYHWVAKHFLEKIRMNLDMKVTDMMREINDLFGITVSKQTCYRARAEARTKLLGTLDDHYHMLPAYVAELKRVNRRGTFELVLDRATPDSLVRFKRLYICFDSIARGFLEGYRRVIGMDGCFLKTELKGQLLSAVGKDGNNQMFPIAWAVVEGENQSSWTWFIQLLMNDLGMVDGNGWTIISDQQKVLNLFLWTLIAYC
ncbi:uncharacterized protein LOC144712171 [Wolffia australiana]